jgi:hypothetical protein
MHVGVGIHAKPICRDLHLQLYAIHVQRITFDNMYEHTFSVCIGTYCASLNTLLMCVDGMFANYINFQHMKRQYSFLDCIIHEFYKQRLCEILTLKDIKLCCLSLFRPRDECKVRHCEASHQICFPACRLILHLVFRCCLDLECHA